MMKQISKQSVLHKSVSAHYPLSRFSIMILVWSALLLTGLLSWQSASALSLGKLQVLSQTNEPLQIDIEIKEENPGEAQGVAIGVANPEEFAKNNRQYTPLLAELAFVILKKSDGQLFLRINSDSPFPLKQLDLILVVLEKNSTVKRSYQYTFDLDTQTNPKAANRTSLNTPKIPKTTAATPTPVKPPVKPGIKEDSLKSKVEAQPKNIAAQDAIPKTLVVQPGQSMSQIASEHLAPGASLNQMLTALYFNNLQAFPERNINLIRAGQKIGLPTAAQVQNTSKEQIADVTRMLTEDFNQYRQKLAQQSQALPKAKASQDSRGKVSALEVDDPLTQALDKLTLSASKDSSVTSTSAGNTKSEAATLAQQKQADLAQKRQIELEQNVRDLQALDSDNQNSTSSGTGTNQQKQEISSDSIIVPLSTPEIASAAPSAPELEHNPWWSWWPYALAALVLLWVLLRLLRLAKDKQNNQGFVEDPSESTFLTPTIDPLSENDSMPPAEEQNDPLKFSVSNQHFDLSTLDLDLNDPPPYKKVNPQDRDTD